MADRYWVGGTGTWDATDTTHWSTSSGGAAGASAPTSADNVFFDTLSNATAYAVNVGLTAVAANCLDVSFSGPLAGNVTLTSAATSVINCYGSWLNATTGIAFSTTAGAVINFLATTTGKTITGNGVSFGALGLVLNSVTGGWTLGSALTVTSTFFVTSGTFSTSASNYSMTCSAISSSGTLVRNINFNASTIILSGPTAINFTTATNLTFSAGTSNITASSTAPTLAGSGQTFYNVTFSSASVTSISMTGANTFNNLTFPVRTTSGFATVTFSANITVTGTFTSITSSITMRLLFASSVLGTQITITAGTTSLTYADFRDIVGAGTAAWTGTSIGNCLNNSGITFDTPKTVYWNLGGSVNWANTGWATTSGGSPAVANFPLAQDTAVFNDAGSAVSIGGFNHQVGTIDMSARTTAIALNNAGTQNIYGSFINSTGATWTASGTFTFLGRSAQTIKSNNIAFTQAFSILMFGGTLTLQDNFSTASTQTVTLTNGTLNLVSYTLTMGLFNTTNTNVRVLAFGTGNITLTGNNTTIWTNGTATNFSITGTPTVNSTYSGSVGTRTFQLATTTGGTEANSLNVNISAGTDAITIGASGKVGNLNLSGWVGTFTASSLTYYGDLTKSAGMTDASGGTSIFAATSGTKTITSNGVVFSNSITFNGIGGTWSCVDALPVTSALTLINGTLQLAAGTTSTVGSFATSGSNIKYLQSTTPGTQASISDASGTNTVTYLTIQDSAGTGGASWNAIDSTNLNAGNNTGWVFKPSVGYATGNSSMCFGFGFKI